MLQDRLGRARLASWPSRSKWEAALAGFVILGSNWRGRADGRRERKQRAIGIARECDPRGRTLLSPARGRESTRATITATRRAAAFGVDDVRSAHAGVLQIADDQRCFVRHHDGGGRHAVADHVLLYNFTAVTGVNLRCQRPSSVSPSTRTSPGMRGIEQRHRADRGARQPHAEAVQGAGRIGAPRSTRRCRSAVSGAMCAGNARSRRVRAAVPISSTRASTTTRARCSPARCRSDAAARHGRRRRAEGARSSSRAATSAFRARRSRRFPTMPVNALASRRPASIRKGRRMSLLPRQQPHPARSRSQPHIAARDARDGRRRPSATSIRR